MKKKLKCYCPICGFGIYGNRFHCRDKKHDYNFHDFEGQLLSESLTMGKYRISYMYKYNEMGITWFDFEARETMAKYFPIDNLPFYPKSLTDIENFLLMG